MTQQAMWAIIQGWYNAVQRCGQGQTKLDLCSLFIFAYLAVTCNCQPAHIDSLLLRYSIQPAFSALWILVGVHSNLHWGWE